MWKLAAFWSKCWQIHFKPGQNSLVAELMAGASLKQTATFCTVHTLGLWFQRRWLYSRVASSNGQLLVHNGLMARSSSRQERSDLLGCNFPLWCWGMFLCEPAVGVCFLGWDLWLWSLDVCLVDCRWGGRERGVHWPAQLLLAGGTSSFETCINFTAMD